MALQTEPSAEPRIPLTTERVLHAAVALADQEGMESLSMRRLGQELGVEAMSLYNHVANKEEILDGMVDVVVSEIDPPSEGVDWKTAMRRRVLSAREVLLRHPWASRVIVSRTRITPTTMQYFDSMLGILRDGGFSIDQTHHAAHTMGSRLLGFAQELFEPEEPDPEAEALLLKQITPANYPYITELMSEISHDEGGPVVGTGCDDQVEFEFALDLILDGLERLKAAE